MYQTYEGSGTCSHLQYSPNIGKMVCSSHSCQVGSVECNSHNPHLTETRSCIDCISDHWSRDGNCLFG